MNKFLTPICTAYPKGNQPIFEEWLYDHWKPEAAKTDREPLPAFFTSYWVNTGYNVMRTPRKELQEYIDGLDRSKKYFTVCQYDDGVIIDFKDLDVMQFNMSKNVGVPMPLLCRPHPFEFKGGKKWFANFIGSETHKLRKTAKDLNKFKDYYISFTHHDLEYYCQLIHQSIFTLCYRGYGINSFRIAEAIQYGSIPVYISDEFIDPYGLDFSEFGVKIEAKDAHRIDEILQAIDVEEIVKMQDNLKEIYNYLFTFEGNRKLIIQHLEAEYNQRQKIRKAS